MELAILTAQRTKTEPFQGFAVVRIYGDLFTYRFGIFQQGGSKKWLVPLEQVKLKWENGSQRKFSFQEQTVIQKKLLEKRKVDEKVLENWERVADHVVKTEEDENNE